MTNYTFRKTHHSPIFESSRCVRWNWNRSSEEVETFLAVFQCSVEAFRGADAFLVVQQQAGTLGTAAEAEVGAGSRTPGRSRTSGNLAAVGVTPLAQSVVVAVLARRAFHYAVHAVLRIHTRVACPGPLQ